MCVCVSAVASVAIRLPLLAAVAVKSNLHCHKSLFVITERAAREKKMKRNEKNK